MIENRGKVPTKSQKEFINSLDDATSKSIKEQSDTYAQHLKRYLKTHTDGELHAHVTQTDYDEVIGADAGSAQGKHEDDYFSFEQALFDEINTRKMDQESRKKGGRINVLNSSGDDDKVKRNADGIEYEEVEIWSEEWQCNICGLAQKRSRSRSRSRSRREYDEQD